MVRCLYDVDCLCILTECVSTEINTLKLPRPTMLTQNWLRTEYFDKSSEKLLKI